MTVNVSSPHYWPEMITEESTETVLAVMEWARSDDSCPAADDSVTA
ncbi:hypothetical protein Rcae01_03466 [Novipirellula caenicola]|uniref:Uncharacterized protein n=1 Tax=Novipirellula caenicola TaxID=1536901 RepID=A0ABP9VS74_9BACT